VVTLRSTSRIVNGEEQIKMRGSTKKTLMIGAGLSSLLVAPTCLANNVPAATMDVTVTASTSGYDFDQYQTIDVVTPMSKSLITYGNGGIYGQGIGYASLVYNSFGPSLEGITSAYKSEIASSGNVVQGTFTYYFDAVGPDSFTVDWSAVAAYAQSAVATNYTYVDDQEAFVFVNDVTLGNEALFGFGLSSEDGYYASSNLGPGFALSVVDPGSGSFSVNPGDTYSVQLFIQSALGLGEGPGGVATEGLTSYIDPVFSVSADNPDASDDSLIFSDGITQADITPNLNPLLLTPGVPEPSSWAMILVGFGLIGVAARNRLSPRLN
jgi:hypothetical protein